MPNWCEGILKIRGKNESLINFLVEGLHPTYFDKAIHIEKDEYCYFINEIKERPIKDVYRGFASSDGWIELNREDEQSTICLKAKFAWQIRADQLLELCKKYKVDMSIYGFERGGEFNQDIEIVGGEIIKDKFINFDDYKWECINPIVGG